jgi:hypothetical protein
MDQLGTKLDQSNVTNTNAMTAGLVTDDQLGNIRVIFGNVDAINVGIKDVRGHYITAKK